MFKCLFGEQSFVLYLIYVMIITGIIKERNSFGSIYTSLCKKVKSKKWLIVIISAISGIMPIPGRVVVSAGVLNTLNPERRKNDWKLGIIDYLSTHHYYLWSPLEKSIIILMGALGLSYIQVLSYTLPLLVISLLFLIGYIYFKVNEDDIEIVPPDDGENYPFFKMMAPLLLGIGLIFKFNPALVFSFLAVYYIVITKTFKLKKIFSYINLNLVVFVFCIIFVGNVVKQNSTSLTDFVKNISTTYQINTLQGMGIISIVSFLLAFAMGSSSKYSGIVAILAGVFGLKYLTYFLAVEFSAYLLSPIHKCVSIGKMYFQTPLKKYYQVISLWCSTMIIYSLIHLLWK